MSIARSLLNDFRPLFRMMEDPLLSSSTFPRYIRSNTFGGFQRQAPVEVSEEGNYFVVHAEMPGVKKEDLNVELGNDGQSLSIEGHVNRVIPQAQGADAEGSSATRDVVKSDSDAQSEFRSSFTRSLWLPQPADGKKASAQLEDGILTLRIPKKKLPAPERIAIH